MFCGIALPFESHFLTLFQHKAPVLLGLRVYGYGYVSLHCIDSIQRLKGQRCG